MISANTRKRIQAISIEGKPVERYFAVTSEVPRNTVESRISAMPLNGRSARAGARRMARFFTGNGRGALWSRAAAAAAGGGVTVWLWDNGRIGRHEKTPIDRGEQHPKTGSRYARLGRSGAPLKQFVKNRVLLPS